MSNLRICLLLMLATMAWPAFATDNTYDPPNPPEPNDQYVPKHNVTVTSFPEGTGYTLGSGRYKEGVRVSISTSSALPNWVFKEWLRDGQPDPDHTGASFSFTIGTADVTFTAVYEYREPETPEPPEDPDPPVVPPFNPDNPADPDAPADPEPPTDPDPDPDPPTPPVITPKYALTLVSSPFEACVFNLSSGREYIEGASIALEATGNQSFDFVGWYDQEGTQLSYEASFIYTMPAQAMTLTARWTFNPAEPNEPMNPNDDTDVPFIMGDVNRDGMVTILDVMNAVSFMMGSNGTQGFDVRTADINGDGVVTIYDILALIKYTSIY